MASHTPTLNRVILVVLDGMGVGELPDAKDYGDIGSNTLSNLAREFEKKAGRPLRVPHLTKMGLDCLTPIAGTQAPPTRQGFYAKCLELSAGKDTTSGHWEMMGLPVLTPFAVYSEGFSKEVVDRWIRENNLPGVLGNCAASGTNIIEELGPKHMRTGKPILYTSADSVWQVAAHEQSFGLERLYSICKSARKICDELKISRVIARPFVGNPIEGTPFKRTYNRKDYAQLPFAKSSLDDLVAANAHVLGVGKISNIYAGQGISHNIDTAGNTHGIQTLLECIQNPEYSGKNRKQLIFCNLIDFDMLYGHRRDFMGFAAALEEYDLALEKILAALGPQDLILMTADHGNDPTYPGTDHTREYAPIVGASPLLLKGLDLGVRKSFADIGATITHALLGNPSQATQTIGTSFYPQLVSHFGPPS